MRARSAREGSRQDRSADGRSARPTREQLRRENERLRQENEQLKRQNTEQQKQIANAEEQIANAEEQIANAEEQIADLERQLAARKKNSTNSSKPPSSDGLAGEQRPRHRHRKSKRKAGGQPGHMGQDRPLDPEPDRIVPVLPAECIHCGAGLPQQDWEVQTVGALQRHQVVDLPPIEPVVTEYQYPKVLCLSCGKGTRAISAPEIPSGQGEQLTALIAYLTIVRKMTRRDVEGLLQDLLHLSLSVGTIQKAWEETSDAVQAPYQELEQELKRQPVVHSDETGSRTKGDKRWIWVFCAASFWFYRITASRGAEVLVQVLGDVFGGILCSDRHAAYLKYHHGLAQFCWAHLKRTLLGIQNFSKTSDAECFCRDVLAVLARLFRLWRRFQAPDRGGGLLSRSELILKVLPLEKKIFHIAERYLDSDDREVRNLALALFQHADKLYTFTEKDGVDPTNNVAERALRHAVLLRKISYGNRSAKGEIAVARLLTITQTCKLQQRPILPYLVDAVRCHRRHQPLPSLIAP